MEGYALEMIGRMPFCSSDEIAGVLLRSLDDVRVEVRAMKAAGVVEVVVSGGVRGSPERMNLTRDGAEELARRRGCTMEQLVVDGFAVTNDWMRTILQRSSIAPTFYALAAAASAVQGYSCLWYWRRRDWLDGTLEVGPGFFMLVARIGSSISRDSLKSRLGNMVIMGRDAFINAGLLVPCDRTTQAFVNGWIRAGAAGLYLWTLNEDAVGDLDVDARVLVGPRRDRVLWRDFRLFVETVDGGYGSEAESGLQIEQRTRNVLLSRDGLKDRRFRAEVDAANLGLAERAVLDVVSDWPLMDGEQVRRMTGYSKWSVNDVLSKLGAGDFVRRVRRGPKSLVALGDVGLRYFSWRDRVQLRDMRADWGLSSDARTGSLGVDDISGSKLRLLASQERHTAELYETISLLAEDCRVREGIELLEIVPPHRSERWMGSGRMLRGGRRKHYGVRPDASGVAALPSGVVRPFMLEYERRAKTPAKMNERLVPYRNYYDTVKGSEGWQAGLITLVVFDDRGAAGRFVKYCNEHPYLSATGGGMPLPVFISCLEDLRSVGAAGRCWMHGNQLRRGAMTLAEAVDVKWA